MTRAHTIGSQRTWPLLALALSLAVSAPNAGESRIELTDGSVISGEPIGIQDGVYQIRSPALGSISVPEAHIRSVTPGAAGALGGGTDHGAAIADIQRELASDPSFIGRISELQQDPLVQDILADPALMRRILTGDLEGLRTDERIIQLMSHPSIQAILGQQSER